MKTAVTSVCFGERFAHIAASRTFPTFIDYSDKIGADFYVFRERVFPDAHPFYEKLQIGSLLDTYDRVVYLDVDAYVKPNCPNLFDIVPYGWFGAFSEGMYLDRSQHLARGSVEFNIDIKASPELRYRYFNAGVLVFDKTHRSVFDVPKVFHNNFGDQTYLNLQVYKHNVKFVDIGPHFNRMPSMRWPDRKESFIIHYAGVEKKYLEAGIE